MLALVALAQVLCLAPAAALASFPSKFLVGEVSGQLAVTCDAPQEKVTWRQNGDPEIMAEHRAAGRTLTLQGLDLPATGNYSCWRGARLLDSTYVVLSDPHYPLLLGTPGACGGGTFRRGQVEGRAVTCQAESYSGELTCSWTALRRAAFRARISRRPGAPGPWLHVDGAAQQDPDQPRLFTVTLRDGTFCPFAEESRMLELELEGISNESFVSATCRLFLRDIVRPGPPRDVAAHSEGGKLHLSWDPPASWTRPHSYFPLRYQLEYQHPNGTTGSLLLEGVTEMSLGGDVRRVQIRCQDPLVNSTWSPWTTWPSL
ncbi:interleukin-12 subunit beta-like [Pelodiscus sinensis]|uniref:interleukin-12 subunit beta-like n=1 Tax=Pelodiscus sinensis TaxID=13735 RepID=UPI003F6C1E18